MYLKFMISFVEKPSADVSFGFKTIKNVIDVLGYSQALLSQTSFKFTKSKKRRNNLVGIIDRLQKLEQFVMASNDIKYKL